MSTSVTSTPRAAKIEAYSTPMTPAPTTVRVRGRVLRDRISSEVMIVSLSDGTPSGTAASVPVAITMRSAFTATVSRAPRISRVCGSTKRASPWVSVMPLRRIWSRITSVSRLMTCWQRKVRASMVMLSLTL